MKKAISKIGLLSQDITLGLSDGDYLVEQVELPAIARDKVNVTVLPGTVAILGGVKYKGSEIPYKLTRAIVGSKGSAITAYLVPDKLVDSITVSFFGGQHMVSLSSLPTAKAKFSIVGSATVEVSDFKELAKYFKRSMTKDELVEEINATLRPHLSNEVQTAASQFITSDTTEVTLRAALNDVAKAVISSKKTASALMNMGLMLSARGISMHLNALDDTEDKIKLINDALTDKAIASLDNDLLDRAADDLAAARKHELDMALAGNTTTRNTNTNVSTNGGGNVVINNNGKNDMDDDKNDKGSFCPHCGKKVSGSGVKFCAHCGKKL